jgi:hypothetical protein
MGVGFLGFGFFAAIGRLLPGKKCSKKTGYRLAFSALS